MNSLIIPIAADHPRYGEEIPVAFTIGRSGRMQCIEAIMGLPLEQFDRICFVILAKHDRRYFLSERLEVQIRMLDLNAQIVVLDSPTASEPETIYRTILQEHLSGSIFIKDSDSSFCCECSGKNEVAVFPLENLSWVNPQDKSYVAADDSGFVTNIIEKRIIGHLFSAGGYGFESAETFCQTFESIAIEDKLYLSHIIYYMLLHGEVFRPLAVSEYVDMNSETRNFGNSELRK